MKISDQVGLSVKNLTRRPGRTALTLIGVVIGSCLVVVMISLGIAQNKSNEEMIASFGDLTQIEVYGGSYNASTGQQTKLDDTAVEQFQALEHTTAATPFYQGYNLEGYLASGNNDRYQVSYLGQVIGMYADALEPMGFALESGNWLDGSQTAKDTIPVLVGVETGYSFEDTRKSYRSPNRYRHPGQTDPNGKELSPFVDPSKDKLKLVLRSYSDSGEKTREFKLKVVGVLQNDRSKGYWVSNGIVMRIQDLQMLLAEYKKLTKDTSRIDATTYDSINVKVDDIKNVTSVMDEIEAMGYDCWANQEQLEEMQKSVANNQMILGGLAAISLLVAALNIANTMTMAIYERTREIGVMKVLGCELGDIRRMFLFESGFIGFVGGVIGCLLSLLASFVLNNLSSIMALFGAAGGDMGNLMGGLMGSGMYYYGGETSNVISIIPPWLLGVALIFATLVGLGSGIIPANRAVKISALEAIRHD